MPNLIYTSFYIVLGIFSIVMMLVNYAGLMTDTSVGKYEKRRLYMVNGIVLLYIILGLVRGI